MAKVIKEIDWNGTHFTFTNTFKQSATKSHDILTMTDDKGNEVVGETTWINRPWHRFDLEEAFTEIVRKAFGKKAEDLVLEINKTASSVEDAIEQFFSKFKPEDIDVSTEEEDEIDASEEGRRKALADYLKVDVEEIEVNGDNEFEVDGETYRVYTDEEAEEEFDNSVRNTWEDLGLDGVPSYFKDWILENALDEDALEDVVREDIEYRVDDMTDEEVAEESDLTEEELYTDEGELRDDIDFDSLRDDLVGSIFANITNLSEYVSDMGLDEDFLKDYIDEEAVIEALKDDIEVNGSGRGQELSYYDGEEHDLGNGLFAYRID